MKLEDLPKYYSPKSHGLTDASASTSKDALSITDVMVAQGSKIGLRWVFCVLGENGHQYE